MSTRSQGWFSFIMDDWSMCAPGPWMNEELLGCCGGKWGVFVATFDCRFFKLEINFGWQWRSRTPISNLCCLALRKRSPTATSAQSTQSFQAFRSRILGEFMFKKTSTPRLPDRSSRRIPSSNSSVSNSGDFWLIFSHLTKIFGEEFGAARKFPLYKYLA